MAFVRYEYKTKRNLRRLQCQRAGRYLEAWGAIVKVAADALMRDGFYKDPILPGLSDGSSEEMSTLEQVALAYLRKDEEGNSVALLKYHHLFALHPPTDRRVATDQHLLEMLFAAVECFGNPDRWIERRVVQEALAVVFPKLRRLKQVILWAGKGRVQRIREAGIELPFILVGASDDIHTT